MRRILGVIICCFVVATAYFAYVIAERQSALQKFARYDDAWDVSQAFTSYLRLEHQLATYSAEGPDANSDDMRLRIDVMINQLGVLQQGTLRNFIQSDPERRQLIANLNDVVTELDNNFETLDADGIKQVLQKMSPFDGPMTRLSASIVQFDIAELAKAQNVLRRLHFIYTGLAAGLILAGVVLVFLLLRHNNLLDRAYGHTRRLTDELREASQELQTQNNRLEHDAHHDALTGLPNRILFRQDLTARLLHARAGQPAAILLFDLDGFKEVNDTLGHDVGDSLLQAIAKRLLDLTRPGDLVCRLGGDEFAVVSTGLTQEAALDFARRLVKEISQPYSVNDLAIKIGSCVGVALADRQSDTEELFKHADLALYEAKALGPGHISFFQSQMQTRLKERKSIETDLQKALQNGEIEVHYQPQATTITREICGYEALLRWTHPVRGMVPPSDFIPVAEKTGMIHVLGDWVLKMACREAARWNLPLKIAVNLSPIQFRSQNLFQSVFQALEESGLSPSRLELEITESVLLDKNEQTLDTLRRLKTIGVQIAMDDFGTGYSSLGSLSGFPFDKIKIDRSFIRDVTTRPNSLAIVELAVGVGRSLRMTTIAEGIETEEQFECLKRLGCDQIQGYLIGRPAPTSSLAYLYGKKSYIQSARGLAS
ncbi:putative bifunctional diguanylate cyclase/phosphodiesterase [Methylovirgula sp. 4M-Z18]|uniref:putative bifunctional diguanylate cyclase/phosphodiesterase n=1 Tax=Methylovirgula sp. 4M-Z18 TaxID=2293567 RepID=UPI000E2F0497|nr:EAL domain-containing protein [Methylovirgula sp. 4M-Z18]RFB81126.1 EAL domain-containing protein [Methylovirgula sp. 4M-Z18]